MSIIILKVLLGSIKLLLRQFRLGQVKMHRHKMINFRHDGKKEQIQEQDVYIMSTITLSPLLGADKLQMGQRKMDRHKRRLEIILYQVDFHFDSDFEYM